MEDINIHLQKKYKSIQENEVRYETINVDDADIVIVAFGLAARVAHKAMEIANEAGLKVGLIRPITLFPFPTDYIIATSQNAKKMLVVEMNAGQMLEDVRLAVNGKIPVEFYGRMGGVIPQPSEIVEKLKSIKNP
jgi:2-oxoglutarate ferredoxin oxidoreductase subunit alpha